VPRKRFVSPEFFTHADLFDAEVASGLPLRLAFAALWCQADRRGIFPWKPRELKLACLPYDTVDFNAVLSALQSAGFVMRYDVDGRAFGYVPSFARWQSFHKDERPSDAPAPPSPRSSTVPARCQHGADHVPTPLPHGSSTPASITASSTTSIAASIAVIGPAVAEEVPASRRLTAAANKGIAEQFGEQPVPIRWDHPGTAKTVEDLEAAGVPIADAERWIFDMARSRCPSDGKPPRTLRYYVSAIIDAWNAEQAHRDAATLPRPAGTGTVITWDDIFRSASAPEASHVA
jgi:hypothetical protein